MPGDGEGMDLSVPLLPLELKRLGYKTHMLGSELVLVLRPLLVYFAGASILLSIITTSPKRHLCMTMTTICISLATISNDPVNQPATHTHTHTRALLQYFQFKWGGAANAQRRHATQELIIIRVKHGQHRYEFSV